MNDCVYKQLCEKHGLTVEQSKENLRTSGLVSKKYALILELRDVHRMKFTEMCVLMGYADRSGARLAYNYAKELKKGKQ